MNWAEEEKKHTLSVSTSLWSESNKFIEAKKEAHECMPESGANIPNSNFAIASEIIEFESLMAENEK